MNNGEQIKIFLKQWLPHAFVYWLVTTGYVCSIYYLSLLRNGNYLWHEDGSPTSVWDRFYEMNRYQYVFFWALLFTLLVELLRSRFYSQRKFPLFVVATAIVGILWSLIHAIYSNIKFNTDLTFGNIFNVERIVNFLAYAIIYAVAREFITQKLYRREVRLAKSESELSALKAQVNPHFFFNTFNYVYGTALQEKAFKTAKAIEMMTEMMRYTMSVMQDKLTPLTYELRFIQNYVDLQLLRLPDRSNIMIKVNLPNGDQANGMIAPMLIIPFVENAFRYAIRIEEDCFIDLKVYREVDQLRVEIKNSIPANESTEESLGTGINNVRERLKLLYPKSHYFNISQTDKIYQVEIKIPIE